MKSFSGVHKDLFHVYLRVLREAPEFLLLGMVFAAVLVVQAAIVIGGFVYVSMDEISRVLLGASWADSPRLFPPRIWLPGHFYLLGSALKLHYDLFLTPRILTMAFSFVALVILYLISRHLFNRWVALVATIIIALNPIYIELSLAPLSGMVFTTLILVFLYSFLKWWESGGDHMLLIAAVAVGFATSVRYEAWFTMALFNAYLGFRWLSGLRQRSLNPVWLTAIGIASLPAGLWLVSHYVTYGNPIYFTEQMAMLRTVFSAAGRFGPLSDYLPHLGYVDMVLKHGGMIPLLAIAGIIFAQPLLGRKLWMYLLFALIPLIGLTLTSHGNIPSGGRRYIIQYLFALAPLCGYMVYWAITTSPKLVNQGRWIASGIGLLALMCAYNLWVVYLMLCHDRYIWVMVSFAGIILSYWLLSRKLWIYLTLSLLPLIVAFNGMKLGFLGTIPQALLEDYFVLLVIAYGVLIWRVWRETTASNPQQWQLAGLGFLAISIVINLWGLLFQVHSGTPGNSHKVGLLVREFYDDGDLRSGDRILLEASTKRRREHKIVQVMSNHPGNFVIDRIPFDIIAPVPRETDKASFLLDGNSAPYPIKNPYVSSRPARWYEVQPNPLYGEGAISVQHYLEQEQIALVLVKEARLKTLFSNVDGIDKIAQIADYAVYIRRQ